MKSTPLTLIWLIIALLGVSMAAIIYLKWPDGNTHIIFCDVGQGDAVLITQGFTQVLIDSGPNDSVLTCLNHFVPFWDHQIELAVTTHAHLDHIGGFSAVLDRYSVRAFLTSNWGMSTDYFLEYWRKIHAQQLEQRTIVIEPVLGGSISLSSLDFKILFPRGDSGSEKIFEEAMTEQYLSDILRGKKEDEDEINSASIGLFLRVGTTTILLTGDLGTPEEIALLSQGLIKDTDILKVGHHGSKTSSSLPFLLQVRPEIAVISCGKKNTFGHPNGEVIDNLSQVGSLIWRTDEKGSLEVITNGQEYWLNE
jgi:competence protein ComEC